MMTQQPETLSDAHMRSPATRRDVLVACARLLLTTVGLVTLYYVLPLDREVSWATVGWLALGLIAFMVLVVFQIRSILRSRHPALRAVETLGTAVPLFVLVFASTYLGLAAGQQEAFTEPLNKTDALYFTMTVLSTVGFGDIAPRTGAARVITTLQMTGNLVVLGLLARVVVGAVQITRQRQSERAASGEERS
jgi:hypothetical protein